MTPNKIVFRVDSFYEIGSGHFYRCFAIAEKLKKLGKHVAFVGLIKSLHLKEKLNNADIFLYEFESFEGLISEINDEYIPYSEEFQLLDAKNTLKAINIEYDLIVVDSYKLDHIWEKKIYSSIKKIMVIDDLSNRMHKCDILLDQTFNKKPKSYEHLVNSDCNLLVGEEFTIIRDEFSIAKKKRQNYKINKNDISALISFGGGSNELTYQACLELLSLKEIKKINIIIGPLDKLTKINEFKFNNRVKLINNTNKMGDLLAQSSIVIGASGGSTWERLYVGVPSFQLIISKNQREISELLAKENYIKLIRRTDDISLEVRKWISGEIKFNPFNKIDGQGLSSVINKILELTI